MKKKTILHRGAYSEVDASTKADGLNLQKMIMNHLVSEGLYGTVNGKDYFPLLPTVICANPASPTEEEIKNVPPGGIFKATLADWKPGELYYMFFKSYPTISDLIVTNE